MFQEGSPPFGVREFEEVRRNSASPTTAFSQRGPRVLPGPPSPTGPQNTYRRTRHLLSRHISVPLLSFAARNFRSNKNRLMRILLICYVAWRSFLVTCTTPLKLTSSRSCFTNVCIRPSGNVYSQPRASCLVEDLAALADDYMATPAPSVSFVLAYASPTPTSAPAVTAITPQASGLQQLTALVSRLMVDVSQVKSKLHRRPPCPPWRRPQDCHHHPIRPLRVCEDAIWPMQRCPVVTALH